MCTFCVKHGDGKRWYLNAASYAADLESDLRRRGFMVDFVRGFEGTRRSVRVGLGALRFTPRPLREEVARQLSERQQAAHFGQPVPIEQCDAMLDLATNVTRVPCVCRGAMQPGSDAESCCLIATVAPHDALLAECFRDYRGGPRSEGFEKLTKEQALACLHRAEVRGLAHTAWTFGTPFIAAICSCDLPSGCLAMDLTLRRGVKLMWKGEDVARLDPARCSGCGACVPRCPFHALRRLGERQVTLDRGRCWGCGTCRASCARAAIALEPRREAPDVATSW